MAGLRIRFFVFLSVGWLFSRVGITLRLEDVLDRERKMRG